LYLLIAKTKNEKGEGSGGREEVRVDLKTLNILVLFMEHGHKIGHALADFISMP
jgi:hypothetical protein